MLQVDGYSKSTNEQIQILQCITEQLTSSPRTLFFARHGCLAERMKGSIPQKIRVFKMINNP